MKTKRLSLAEKIAINRKENEKLKKKILKDGSKLFNQAVKYFFKKYNDLDSFDWTQYTPNWNDGSECVFSCHFDSISINSESEKGHNEGLWLLQEICELLKNKTAEESRIVMELANKEDKKSWEVEKLKSDLETIKTRNFEEVFRKYTIKKEISETLSLIEEEVYKDMFGEGKIIINREGASIEDCLHD
jgi:hypothetical protein